MPRFYRQQMIFWLSENGKYRECVSYIETLRYFNIKQPFNVFLAAFSKFTPIEFIKLMEYVQYISIRYNVICNKLPSEQEKVYNVIARKIRSGEIKRASHVKNLPEFRKVYPSDEEFITAFQGKRVAYKQSKKKVKYLLTEIEKFLGDKTINFNEVTVEHILPDTPDGAWRKYFGEDCDDAIDKLENMLLLLEKDNKAAARSSFEKKKQIYGKSKFRIAQQVSKFEEWDRESMSKHQHWLAEQAAKVWRIEY